jgi:hypothetical protein
MTDPANHDKRKAMNGMPTPTEAELFADLLEYRAALDVLRVFDAGFVVNVERAHVIVTNGAYTQMPTYMVKIRKMGVWEVQSDPKESVQQAAEQAKNMALEEIEKEPLLAQAKLILAQIKAQQEEKAKAMRQGLFSVDVGMMPL